ncbi:hypothetical protein [Calothrix sp. NIES-2098]
MEVQTQLLLSVGSLEYLVSAIASYLVTTELIFDFGKKLGTP